MWNWHYILCGRLKGRFLDFPRHPYSCDVPLCPTPLASSSTHWFDHPYVCLFKPNAMLLFPTSFLNLFLGFSLSQPKNEVECQLCILFNVEILTLIKSETNQYIMNATDSFGPIRVVKNQLGMTSPRDWTVINSMSWTWPFIYLRRFYLTCLIQ